MNLRLTGPNCVWFFPPFNVRLVKTMPRTKAAALSIVHLKKSGVALKACVYWGNCLTVHQAAIVSNMFRFNSIQLPMNKLE